jgi:hypothetical protein
MSDFFSLPISAKTTPLSPKAFWMSQGLLLAATAGSFIAIAGEIQKNRTQTTELLSRFHLLEQAISRLAAEVVAIRSDLATQTTSAAPRSRSTARSQRTADSESVVPALAQEQTKEASPKKKSSVRKPKQAAGTPPEAPTPTPEQP